jgi:hypothetical protein
MLTFDLFKEDFAVVEQEEKQEPTMDRTPEPVADPRTSPDQNTKTHAAVIFQQLVKAFKIQQPIITLEWPGKPAVTLTRNQMYSVLKQIVNKPANVQSRWVPILGSRDEFINKLSTMKIEKAPTIRRTPSEPGQGRLDLDEVEKKSSQEPKFKSTRLNRLKQQAAAKYPAAASDVEALVADFVDQQDSDAKEFEKVRGVNRRQDELLKQLNALNQQQQGEINDLEGEEAKLQKNIQGLQAVNADLLKKLTAMARTAKDKVSKDQEVKGKEKVANVEPEKQSGIYTMYPNADRVPPGITAAPASAPAPQVIGTTTVGGQPAEIIDAQARKQAEELAQQLQDLRSQKNMWDALKDQGKKVDPDEFAQVKQDIGNVRQQLEKLVKSQSVVKSYRGQKTPTKGSSKAPGKPSADQMRGKVQPTGVFDVDQEFGDLFGRMKQPATVQEVHDIVSGQMGAMIEDELDEVSMASKLSAKGQLQNLLKVRDTAILSRQQAQKIQPTPAPVEEPEEPGIEPGNEMTAQDLLFRTAAKAMYDAGQQGVDMDYETAIRTASKLMKIPYAPSMLPALRSQLADVEKQLATMKAVKKNKRAREQEKLTHQTTPDEERRAQQFWKDYNKRFKGRISENDSSKAYEEGGREGYYHRPNRNPYDPGTQEYKDYNRGYEFFKGDKDWDVPKRQVKENEISVTGQPVKQEKGYYSIWVKKENRWTPVTKYPDRKEAEEIKRGLEKRGLEVIIREGRAGYNPLTSQEHWHEVERQLSNLLNNPSLDPQSRAEVRQRYLEKRKEAQQKGWAK